MSITLLLTVSVDLLVAFVAVLIVLVKSSAVEAVWEPDAEFGHSVVVMRGALFCWVALVS